MRDPRGGNGSVSAVTCRGTVGGVGCMAVRGAAAGGPGRADSPFVSVEAARIPAPPVTLTHAGLWPRVPPHGVAKYRISPLKVSTPRWKVSISSSGTRNALRNRAVSPPCSGSMCFIGSSTRPSAMSGK